MSEHAAENDASLLRAELAEALAADLSERPQRCGHSSDPMCCPYENFPTLAAFFKAVETPPVPDEFDPWDTAPISPAVPDGAALDCVVGGCRWGDPQSERCECMPPTVGGAPTSEALNPQPHAEQYSLTDADVETMRAAHRDSYPMGNIHHGTPERPDWGTFCVECKESWPCEVARLIEHFAPRVIPPAETAAAREGEGR